ncbi:MAG: hypothetical protein BWY70_01849 [Bacteroidetes bacterium ADurb.Bin408]|nr:MAG: hypothetical protein BWY70_01849 [Bacteroidetes bacterium ADurb.Bin408]
MNTTAQKIIEHLNLAKHPEGGWYREIYRSAYMIPANGLPHYYGDARYVSTSIYYLLTGNEFSAFHRLKSDEIWHFYLGSPLQIHLIGENKTYTSVIMGNKLENNEHLQWVIQRNTWFAAGLMQPESYALIGCTVAPGFHFSDFELGKKDVLKKLFPAYKDIIDNFTH